MKISTLIVPFEVLEDQKNTLCEQWHTMLGVWKHEEHFYSARLYEVDAEVENYLVKNLGFHWLRDRPGSRARFGYIAIVQWLSLPYGEAATYISQIERQISFPAYPAFYHTEGDGLTAASSRSKEKTFTLIVPFEVPEGQEEVLHKQWQEIVDGMGKVEGSLGPGLYEIDAQAEGFQRGLRSPQGHDFRASFRFVNVAEWTSLADYEAAIRSVHHVKPISFPSYGAYYHVVDEYPNHII
ncbi:antibiotic biosynthesis monooxygenase family protein [Ktedonospora formicarum]|uniref:ABM domain-containing protein n=1 Tax=Ktedonospora formicarum TaxID=2778364 RepID=A0A8J3HW74_9CHLR|nr:antibiotic biosynthesis monooxygenase [Ktedonospora formicarum]GHO42135.1 hypothetical protein KSX_02980 [Ktedonospora formicarum]